MRREGDCVTTPDGLRLPPLVKGPPVDGKFEWEPVTVDAQRIGRILAYHLVIEHYLDNYLETRTNYTLGWAAAR